MELFFGNSHNEKTFVLYFERKADVFFIFLFEMRYFKN